MSVFSRRFTLKTQEHNAVVDITESVRRIVSESGVRDGVCTVFTRHATAAITINENADPNIGRDFLSALKKLIIEHDGRLHDCIDNTAVAHIKSARRTVGIDRGGRVRAGHAAKPCSSANLAARA
jgi:secondary thiamine-phosphate synthase enzyme